MILDYYYYYYNKIWKRLNISIHHSNTQEVLKEEIYYLIFELDWYIDFYLIVQMHSCILNIDQICKIRGVYIYVWIDLHALQMHSFSLIEKAISWKSLLLLNRVDRWR